MKRDICISKECGLWGVVWAHIHLLNFFGTDGVFLDSIHHHFFTAAAPSIDGLADTYLARLAFFSSLAAIFFSYALPRLAGVPLLVSGWPGHERLVGGG